jgi:hypothetical protein
MVMQWNFGNELRSLAHGSGRERMMVHTPTRMQHALLASLDRDTKLAIARAYRARRQVGESNHPAVQAALEAPAAHLARA